MSLPILLAATDISAPSRFTAQRAAMLSEQIGAKLEFVHALDKSELDELQRLLGEDGEVLKERIRSQTRELLAQLANDVGEPIGVSAGCRNYRGKLASHSFTW